MGCENLAINVIVPLQIVSIKYSGLEAETSKNRSETVIVIVIGHNVLWMKPLLKRSDMTRDS